MGYANSVYDGSVTVHLNDRYWVKLRHLRSREAFAVADSKGTDNERAVGALAYAICEWNLDDDNGNILPIDPDSIAELSQAHLVKVSEAFAEMEGAKGGEATFPGGGDSGGVDNGRLEGSAPDLSAVRA